MSFVYDAGALIAAERSDREFLLMHRRALKGRNIPVVPAAVIAQVWSGAPREALVARVLKACEIEPLDERQARAIGRMRVASGISDVVDISVVEAAARRSLTIITSDPDDIMAIIDGAGVHVPRVQVI